MSLRNWVYVVLNRGIRSLTALTLAIECADYARRVHGGPAPVDWRTREGIPASDQWGKLDQWGKKAPGKSGRLLRATLVKGKVEQPSIHVDGRKHTLGAWIPTPEIDAAWGNDDWLRVDETDNG